MYSLQCKQFPSNWHDHDKKMSSTQLWSHLLWFYSEKLHPSTYQLVIITIYRWHVSLHTYIYHGVTLHINLKYYNWRGKLRNKIPKHASQFWIIYYAAHWWLKSKVSVCGWIGVEHKLWTGRRSTVYTTFTTFVRKV